jgi:hypothetical protein
LQICANASLNALQEITKKETALKNCSIPSETLGCQVWVFHR